MLKLDIRHWETLLVIAEAGTMREAAGRLGLTQSALSHRLAEAERRLGGLLFVREGRRLRLSPAGRAAAQSARQVLPALARAESDFESMAAHSAQVVRFGIAAYSAYHWLPRFLRELRAARRRIEVDVIAAATQQPVRSLFDGAADLVLAPSHLAVPGIEAVPLFEDELVLVVAPDHRLAGRDHVEAEDLRDEDYMTYSRTVEPGFEYERFIRPSGVIPRMLSTVEMTDAVLELVASGFGISILAKWAIRPTVEAGRVATVRVGRDGLRLNWSALLRATDLEDSAARSVADTLAAWCGGAPPPS